MLRRAPGERSCARRCGGASKVEFHEAGDLPTPLEARPDAVMFLVAAPVGRSVFAPLTFEAGYSAPVSHQNVELLRRVLEAYNARDIEGFIAYCDPDIEFHSAFSAVGGADYHGHDGLRMWHRDVSDVWGGETRVELEAYFDLGEQTLAFYLLHGRGQRSGLAVAMPVALVTRWRKGLIVYVKGYAHRDALSELGVTEDSLEPIEP
jgi:ketosteroid isomerase-like protein